MKDLQIDYIDLVLIHIPGLPPNFRARNAEHAAKMYAIKDLAEARIGLWEALQFCQKKGKIKHIGVSNFTRFHMEQLIRNPR